MRSLRAVILVVNILLVLCCNGEQLSRKEMEDDFKAMGSYRYYEELKKCIDVLKPRIEYDKKNDSKERIFNDTDYFRPRQINRIKRIDAEVVLRMGSLPGEEWVGWSYEELYGPDDILPPPGMFRYLFYVDEEENYYFGRSDSMRHANYSIYSNKNNKGNVKKEIKQFYKTLENSNFSSAIFFDGGRYQFIESGETIYFDNDIKLKMQLDENKKKYILVVISDQKSNIYNFPEEQLGSEIFFSAENERILYIDTIYPDFNLVVISEYNYKRGSVDKITLIPFLSSEFYNLLGVDGEGRIYFYRSTSNSIFGPKAVYIPYASPEFEYGEVQVYDLKNRTLTILQHPFPEPEGIKPAWAFYVVQRNRIIYCHYMNKGADYVVKLTPDWDDVEPYPNYLPILSEELKTKLRETDK